MQLAMVFKNFFYKATGWVLSFVFNTDQTKNSVQHKNRKLRSHILAMWIKWLKSLAYMGTKHLQ